MKKVILSLAIFASVLCGASFAFAQPVDDIDEPGTPVSYNTPDVNVSYITLGGTSFKAGQTIKGLFYAENLTDEKIADLHYRIGIVNEDGVTYDEKSYDPVFISGRELKKISFSYVLPKNIPQGELSLYAQAFLREGTPLGFETLPIEVSDRGDSPVTVISTSVMVEGRGFHPEEGPSVDPDVSPELVLNLSSQVNTSAIPYVEIFKESDLVSPVVTAEAQVVPLVAGNEVRTKIVVPAVAKGGVYVGTVKLRDSDLNQLAPVTTFRYIVRGQQAAIIGFSTDVSSVRRGGDIQSRLDYQGAPFDIVRFEQPQQETGKVRIALYNEKDELVAEINKDLNLNVGGTGVDNTTFSASKSAAALRAEVTIMNKDGEVIDQLTSYVSPGYEDVRENALGLTGKGVTPERMLITLGLAIIVLVVVILCIGLWKRKQIAALSIILVGILVSGFLMSKDFVMAQVSSKASTTLVREASASGASPSNLAAPTISINVPSAVAPGAAFQVKGSVSTVICNNMIANAAITVAMRSGAWNNATGQVKRNYSGPSATEEAHGDDKSLITFKKSFRARFTAPTTPGTYFIVVRGTETFTNNGEARGSSWSRKAYSFVVTDDDACPDQPGRQAPGTVCPDGDDGGDLGSVTGGDGPTVITATCTEDVWECGAWGSCVNGLQSRSCTMTYDCPTATTPEPAESQACVGGIVSECTYPADDGSCPPPEIDLSVFPKTLGLEDTCTVSWSVQGAEECTLEDVVVTPTAGGSKGITITSDEPTVYTMRCTNGPGVATKGIAACGVQITDEE